MAPLIVIALVICAIVATINIVKIRRNAEKKDNDTEKQNDNNQS